MVFRVHAIICRRVYSIFCSHPKIIVANALQHVTTVFDRSKTGLPASGLGGSYLAHKEPNNAKLGFQPSWVDVNRSLGKFRFREGGWWVVGGWNLHIEVHQVLQLP